MIIQINPFNSNDMHKETFKIVYNGDYAIRPCLFPK